MGRQKKQQFINKKSAQTFHVVHRSQKDPLQADEDSSKFVLQELRNLNAKTARDEKRKEEQREHGIFFEDDYDYTQHIQEANPEQVWEAAPQRREKQGQSDTKVQFPEGEGTTTKSVQLPPEVFPSVQEESIGLLNRAAPISGPRLDLDPDVVAAMDEDFDVDNPDNQLDDDFVLMAQRDEPLEDEQNDGYSNDDEDDVSSGGGCDSDSFEDEDETQSRFTSYTLSSSVIRRSDGLTLLDDRFEKIYEEYDDIEMGALEHDDIEGHVIESSELLDQVLTEFEKSQKKLVLDKDAVDKVNQNSQRSDEDSADDDDIIKMKYDQPKKDIWDCESIISTYSNLYNHPKIIQDLPQRKKQLENTLNGTIKLSQKTGMPLGVLPTPGPTKKQLERQEIEEYRLPLVVPQRIKGQKETLEQKKDRKQAVKQDRKARRIEKKTNQEAFKEEEKIQKKVLLNMQQNLQGVRIS